MRTQRRPATRRSQNFRNAAAHHYRQLLANPLEWHDFSSYHSFSSATYLLSDDLQTQCPLWAHKRTFSEVCCQKQTLVGFSWLRVHPFDPLCAPGARLERVCKILCFPCNLVAAELHDAHGVGRLTVICQDVFGDPKITAANDSPHSETLFIRLLGACDLYVASTADSLA